MERFSESDCSSCGLPVPVDLMPDGDLVRYADAQATIAALQARVKELEARQHFGACAKCLTNAWRICKDGTPDAVEMKCSNGSTWWLCDYCLSKEQLTQRTAECDALKLVNDTHMKTVMKLSHVVEQQTAELEAVKADTKNMLDVATRRLHEQVNDLQAELEAIEKILDIDSGKTTVEKVRDLHHSFKQVWESYQDASNEMFKAQAELERVRAEKDRLEAAMELGGLQHRQGMEG